MSRIKRDDITHFIDEDIYLPTRTLYMGSTGDNDGLENGVNYSMAERMIKGLHILDSSATEQPITIIMNNLGGDFVHGMAIYDAIKICRNHITIKVFGHAMSMGAIILQAER
jgi:ATP-dependent protease ClpP protease subunit